MANQLSDHQQRLLAALKAHGGWMRHPELAKALGKDILSPEDVRQLDLLGDSGMLVREYSDDKSPEGLSVRYRYAEPKSSLRTSLDESRERS